MPKSLTPSERTLRARLAAHVSHSRHDPKERTRPARDVFDQRFLDEVDPQRVLPDAEREAGPITPGRRTSPGWHRSRKPSG